MKVLKDGVKIGKYTLQEIELTESNYYFMIEDVMENIEEYNKPENCSVLTFIQDNQITVNHSLMNKKIMYLDEFVIEKEYRGKDFGSIALEEVSKRLSECGYDYLVLRPYPIGEVSRENFEQVYNKLIQFYIKNGFTPLDERVDYFYMFRPLKKRLG